MWSTWMVACRGLSWKASVDGRTGEPSFPQSPGPSWNGYGPKTSGMCTLSQRNMLVCQAWTSWPLWAVHGAQLCRESALLSEDHSESFSVRHSVGHWEKRCTHTGLIVAYTELGMKPGRKCIVTKSWVVIKQGITSDVAGSRVPSSKELYFSVSRGRLSPL